MENNNTTQNVFLTLETFKRDLEICLVIIKNPSKINQYYVCEYTSPNWEKRIINIHIIKN